MKIRNMEVERLIITHSKSKRAFVVLHMSRNYIVEERSSKKFGALRIQPKTLCNTDFKTPREAFNAVYTYIANKAQANDTLDLVIKNYGPITADKMIKASK